MLAVQGSATEDPWMLVPVADLGSIHRLRWGDLDGDKKLELVVAPIFGPRAKPPVYDDDSTVVVFKPGQDLNARPWTRQVLLQHRVIHADRGPPGSRQQGSLGGVSSR